VPLDPLVCFENTMSSLVGDGKVTLSDLKVMMLGFTLSDRSEVLKSPRGDPSLDLIKVDLAMENLMEENSVECLESVPGKHAMFPAWVEDAKHSSFSNEEEPSLSGTEDDKGVLLISFSWWFVKVVKMRALSLPFTMNPLRWFSRQQLWWVKPRAWRVSSLNW
jgi:hypothetical protein